MYITSYMVKEGLTPQKTLPIIRDLLYKNKDRKSTAANRDTVDRHTNFVTQIILNTAFRMFPDSGAAKASIELGNTGLGTTAGFAVGA